MPIWWSETLLLSGPQTGAAQGKEKPAIQKNKRIAQSFFFFHSFPCACDDDKGDIDAITGYAFRYRFTGCLFYFDFLNFSFSRAPFVTSFGARSSIAIDRLSITPCSRCGYTVYSRTVPAAHRAKWCSNHLKRSSLSGFSLNHLTSYEACKEPASLGQFKSNRAPAKFERIT